MKEEKAELLPEDIQYYLNKMQKAAKTGDRMALVDNLFYLAAELACVNGPSKEHFGWDQDYGILCHSQGEADCIANYFDAMYEEGTCITGTWEPEEDRKDGCVNEYTGLAYVRID